MDEQVIFTRLELADLRRKAEAPEPLRCPRCDVPFRSRSVPTRPGVSYVRDRVWYLCPSCGRSAVLDR